MKLLNEIETKLKDKLSEEDLNIVLNELETILVSKKLKVNLERGNPYMFTTGMHKTLEILGI